MDATGASCRGTRFMGASLPAVDLRAADLRGAVFGRNSFHVTLDEQTELAPRGPSSVPSPSWTVSGGTGSAAPGSRRGSGPGHAGGLRWLGGDGAGVEGPGAAGDGSGAD
ncbi:pentapeptide repeat-containing protein, partial [Streptomyces sp. NPDC051207]|uniref:pentapeptide repeat-containing protein n=1 Tax=Streptomyces sp. NPDC051207 TaxID=3154641 RepID=UPI00343CE9AF